MTQVIDKNGQIKVTPDTSGTGFVPYTGATANVDLGAYNLNAANLDIGGATVPPGAASLLSILTGTPPASSPADQFSLFSKDLGGVAGWAWPHARTENGMTGALALMDYSSPNPVFLKGSSVVTLVVPSAGEVTAALMDYSNAGKFGVGVTPTSALHIKGSSSLATVSSANELTADGTFTTTSGWTWTGTDWTFGSSRANHTSGTATALIGSTRCANGEVYKITIGKPNGVLTLTISLGGSVTITTTGSGTSHVGYIKCLADNADLSITANSSYAQYIDTILVQRVLVSTPDAIIEGSDSATTPMEIRTAGGASGNIGIGYLACARILTGSNNVIIGASTMTTTPSGSNNVLIGSLILSNANSAANMIVLGTQAAQTVTAGNQAIVVGNAAASQASTLSLSVIFGAGAVTKLAYTSANDVILGQSAGLTVPSTSQCVLIGSGAAAYETAALSYKLYIGVGSAATYNLIWGDFNLGHMNIGKSVVTDQSATLAIRGDGTNPGLKVQNSAGSSFLVSDAAANLDMYGAQESTNATGVLSMKTGVEPSASFSDQFSLFSKDLGGVAGWAWPHVRTENGMTGALAMMDYDSPGPVVFSAPTSVLLVVPTSGVAVLTYRRLNTDSPITIDGTLSSDLSSDRTIGILSATALRAGSMSAADKSKLDTYPALNGNSATYLNGTGGWTTPPGGGGGTVNVTLPLTGDGSVGTPLNINNFSSGADGAVPGPAAANVTEWDTLRGDGTWYWGNRRTLAAGDAVTIPADASVVVMGYFSDSGTLTIEAGASLGII